MKKVTHRERGNMSMDKQEVERVLASLALYVAHIQAQKCLKLPLTQNCRGGRHSGNMGHGCRNNFNNNMWYYNADRRECLTMSYLGCGGNNNRYCTKSQSIYMVLCQAQNSCRGYVRTIRQTCEGLKDEGHRFGRLCHRHTNNEMWYYDQRSGTCLGMVYYGCGGNTNRYCDLIDCQKKCMRRD
ncbi:hypothetical protein ACLKA7_016303 [Drosophila subpalustris]